MAFAGITQGNGFLGKINNEFGTFGVTAATKGTVGTNFTTTGDIKINTVQLGSNVKLVTVSGDVDVKSGVTIPAYSVNQLITATLPKWSVTLNDYAIGLGNETDYSIAIEATGLKITNGGTALNTDVGHLIFHISYLSIG